MVTIRADDLIDSVADALQYISYYHPQDFIEAMGAAYAVEESPAARDAIAQILTNSRLCAEGHRPLCQDTGIVVAFVKIGMDARIDMAGHDGLALADLVNEGVRRAYQLPENRLRASIVSDPAFRRTNTRDNTPAVTHVELVAGSAIDITVAAKGGGSENKAQFAMLNPSDSVADWVLSVVPEMGAGWCPPGMLGIGIGGSAEQAMLLAKESLMEPIDLPVLRARGAATPIERLRIEIVDRVNALGIGAQGLGGLTTLLDVKVRDYPTHAASLPVAVIPNCAATRHLHFRLDGSGRAKLAPPDLSRWPKVDWAPDTNVRRVSLDTLTREEMAGWKAGERLLVSGKLLTGRDAAHKRICALLEAGQPLPDGLSFQNRVIYYVGPVDPVGNEVVGPADYAAKPGVKKTASGLLYKVIRPGTGPAVQKNSDVVTVFYKGALINGKVFDQTKDEPIQFPVGGVIPGWTEALKLMKTGDVYEIVIPADLGYGSDGAGDSIPPDQVLVFQLQLVKVEYAP